MPQSELRCGKLTCPLSQMGRRCQWSQTVSDSWRTERTRPIRGRSRGKAALLSDRLFQSTVSRGHTHYEDRSPVLRMQRIIEEMDAEVIV